jgi:membrane-bound metal-dependent hydrolase YbcI (DUF457 family)
MGHAHRASALPAALALGYLAEAPVPVRIGAGTLVWFASTWPDLDHSYHSRLHPGAALVQGLAKLAARTRGPRDVARGDVHRGASHSLGGVLVFAALTGWLTWLVPPLAPWWWLWALAAAVGVAVHIAGDCLTPSGCPIFWPVMVHGRRFHRHSLDLFATDSAAEHLVVVMLFYPASAVVALWLVGGLSPLVTLATGWS